jgi:hypothetical protein
VGISFVVCAVTHAADGSDAAQWTAKASPEKCELVGALIDGQQKSSGRIEISWRSSGAYQLTIALGETAPVAHWRFEQADLNESLEYQDRPFRYIMMGGDVGERAYRAVVAGRALTLMARPGVDRHRLTTVTRGVPESLRAFDQCVTKLKATPVPPPPPARWRAETQGGRDCSLRLSDLSGIRGLEAMFGAGTRSSLSFVITANPFLIKDGGVLRIVLPGDPRPFTYDTEAKTVTRDPRTPALYAAIKSGKPIDMTFTVPGAKPIPVRTSSEGLAVASGMFDACAAALRPESLPPRFQFNELRYVVTDQEDGCELTGTFQIDGNAIWITLVSDGTKNVVKVTRRTVGAGYKIRELGLERLGGPKKLTAEDTTIDLDAKSFASLRRDLVANGRDFQIVMSRDRSYTAQFGGALAVVEAPMFEACAHAKFDTR